MDYKMGLKRVSTCLVLAAFTGILLTVGGCGDKVSDLDKRLEDMRLMMERNSEQITANADRIEQNQSSAEIAIADLSVQDEQLEAGLDSVAKDQAKLDDMVNESNEHYDKVIAAMEDRQDRIEVSVTAISENTREVVKNIAAIENRLAETQEMLDSNNQEVVRKIRDIADDQKAMKDMVKTSIDRMTVLMNNVSLDGAIMPDRFSAIDSDM